MTWSTYHAHHIQARLAAAMIPPLPPAELGDITLLPHQRDAVARIQSAFQQHQGALLADHVGLGKTYTALAVARGYEQVHVIAPAALLPMWRTAIIHAHRPHISLHSVHRFSRRPAPQQPSDDNAAAVHHATPRRALVIIDEAHYLRTRRTARYTAIAQFVAGHDTLLLSATPLHNRTADVRNMLALFLGSRADLLSDAILAHVIIRRVRPTTHTTTPSPPTDTPQITPRVQHHVPRHFPHDQRTLTQILALPAPLPAHGGAVAGALIRLGLLRAWCSSDAALAHAVRQRRLRGEALRQALRAGRHPTPVELRSWLVGEYDVQLAFPELLSTHQLDGTPLLERLDTHLTALHQLADHHAHTACGDHARAEVLRTLLHEHPDTPIIAFSQFTQTIGALQRALSDIAGVGLLSSTHARIASGRISRSEALARFAPRAQERPPPPPHHAIRLLLSTDLLAEGVNLQDAGVVVHLDLPWTDALRQQRVGRCARMGSPHAVVHVYDFAPPPAGDRALQLQHRLATKAALATRLAGAREGTELGDPNSGTGRAGPARATRPHESAAESATHVRARLLRWMVSPHTTPRSTWYPTLMVGALSLTPYTAWIALVEYKGQPTLLCAYAHPTQPGRRIVSTRVRALLHAVTMADRIGAGAPAAPRVPSRTILRAPVRHALREMHRWQARQGARDDAGPTGQAVAPVALRAARYLAQYVQQCSAIERVAWREAITDAQRVVGLARGSGAEEALTRWCALAETTPSAMPRTWITAWQREPALANVAAEPRPAATIAAAPSVWRVQALLLIGSDYPSACHDTRSCLTSTAP